MLDIPNNEALAIHITNNCKFNCYNCYNHKASRNLVANLNYIKLAIEKIKPKYVIFYGGECLLEPELLRKAIDICNTNYVIQTAGIFNKSLKDIYDNAFKIGLTVDSFNYEWLKKFKRFSIDDYNNYLEIISLYNNKISMVHNIYPSHNDPNYFRDMDHYGLRIDSYPYMTNSKYQEFFSEFRNKVKIPSYIINNAKFRLLIDGTVSKDMRGIYNLCHINDFDINTKYQYSKLPISEKCKCCKYYGRCFALNTFSAFAKDILDKINYEPHFCRFTKIYHKYQ